MFAEFNGKQVTLYSDARYIMRRFNVPHNVVNVQVSGRDDDISNGSIAITMDNGRTWLYKTNGVLVRR